MEKEDKINDESVGIIPVFKDETEGYLFLIVLHNAGHWGFPKGHKEEGEKEIDTAKRELYEETGVKDIKLYNKKEFFEEYSFLKNGKTYHKKVRYFLALVLDKESNTLTEFNNEIKDTKWLDYSNALNILTFYEAKNLLDEVKEYLGQNKLISY